MAASEALHLRQRLRADIDMASTLNLVKLAAGRAMMMSKATDNLQAAQQRAAAGRPKVGGFPYLAETLRRAGVTLNIWFLPACLSLYLTNDGPVATQGTPLARDREALKAALRTDQAGNSTFPEFLVGSWRAGVVRYDIDLAAYTVSHCGCRGEEYVEPYPSVEVS
jgi:uncharacterized protein YbcV (DUF1398 family)